MIAAIRSFQGNYVKLKLPVGKQQQKQKSVYFNELRSVSLVPLALHLGSFKVHTVHSATMMDMVNDTLLQSGPGLFCLSLKRPAIWFDSRQVTFGRDFRHFSSVI